MSEATAAIENEEEVMNADAAVEEASAADTQEQSNVDTEGEDMSTDTSSNAASERVYTQEDVDSLVHIMTSKMRIRNLFDAHEIKAATVEKMVSKLSDYAKELTEREARMQEIESDIQEKRNRVHEFAATLGLSPDQLMANQSSKSKSTASTGGPAKKRARAIYRIEDENGNPIEIETSAAGRARKDLADYMERTGKTRQECEVKRIPADS